MKFDIEKMPTLPIMPFEDDINEWRAGIINHLESIVKAQGEVLEKYRHSMNDADVYDTDIEYDALQQAIKEAQS